MLKASSVLPVGDVISSHAYIVGGHDLTHFSTNRDIFIDHEGVIGNAGGFSVPLGSVDPLYAGHPQAISPQRANIAKAVMPVLVKMVSFLDIKYSLNRLT